MEYKWNLCSGKDKSGKLIYTEWTLTEKELNNYVEDVCTTKELWPYYSITINDSFESSKKKAIEKLLEDMNPLEKTNIPYTCPVGYIEEYLNHSYKEPSKLEFTWQ